MKNKLMNNKRGLAPLIVITIVIIGIVAFLGLFGGIASAVKINSLIKSTPAWFWYILIGVLFLMLIPKK